MAQQQQQIPQQQDQSIPLVQRYVPIPQPVQQEYPQQLHNQQEYPQQLHNQQPYPQNSYYPSQIPSITIVNQTTSNATAQATTQANSKESLDFSPLIGVLYFLFIGCWLGLCWSMIGLFLCITIIFLPVGLKMLKLMPAITLLYHG